MATSGRSKTRMAKRMEKAGCRPVKGNTIPAEPPIALKFRQLVEALFEKIGHAYKPAVIHIIRARKNVKILLGQRAFSNSEMK